MNVYVCVKQVPDPNAPGKMDPATNRLVREGVELVMDPWDEYGVEAGLQLVEQHGGVLTVISMGPERAKEAMRKALAMGAERGVLVSDPALAGSDALATARALAEAIKRESPDIVICGTESSDGSTGLMPGMLAELLGWPQLTFAKKLAVGDGKATIHRQTEVGFQIVEAPLPVVVTVTGGINEPRYPSLKGIMTAKRKEIVELSVGALGLSADQVGAAGAKEQVLDLAKPEERQSGTIASDEGDGGVKIADFLQQRRFI
ncbi:MAG: electron transfer flavoprotein subunit beta/FixA family protein [Chloroflexi bacterium]|nr:electron transfer flavoprotein subunit beta/FixA family protein [Chloroflexota bacterium]